MLTNIRPATSTDYQSIYEIWLEGIANSFSIENYNLEEVSKKFRRNFDERNSIFNFWVAVNDSGDIMGWQSLIPFSNNPFRMIEYAESSTYISLHQRKMNLGSQLLAHALGEAKKNGLKFVVGFVASNNHSVIRLTQEIGFKLVGEMPNTEQGILKLFLIKAL